MRIVMGRVRRDRPAAVKKDRQPPRPDRVRHAAPPAAARKTGQRQSGKWVFVLLAAAFIATAAAGIHEGLGGGMGATAQKAAVLSAQMVYPQGGQSIMNREFQKLHTLFSGTGQQSLPSSAASKTGK